MVMNNTGSLKPLICPQCGGKISRASMTCEYCGTVFKEDNGLVKIVETRHDIHTLGTALAVDKMDLMINPEEFSEYAIRHMAQDLANCLIPYMNIWAEEDKMLGRVMYKARLRVVDSSHKF